MIKSAKKEKYYGTLAYADGEIRKVIEYTKEVTESADGIKHNEYWGLKGLGYVSKIVSVEAYKIMTALDTVTAVVKVDGRTYIGHAQCNPNDQFDGAFGRKLALARAMHDHSMINYLEELSNWSVDADGTDEDDDDEEFISAGDVDGTETLYCCQCGEPIDADEAIPDSYTDDIYCCQSCYLAAGGNIDPDGDDDDGDNNYCDYCLEDIPDGTNFVDADGHQYCCAECMEKALAEKDSDDEE